MPDPSAVPAAVTTYLESLGRLDFDRLAGTLAEDVERVGPWGDVVIGRHAYAAFLANVISSLPGYRLGVHRALAAGPRGAVAEISERIDLAEGPTETPGALLFDLDDDGLITRVAVYLQQPPP
jgi:hypothetical protein